MPGDPKECREHAKRCLQLADETTNPALKDSLLDISRHWMRLAADLQDVAAARGGRRTSTSGFGESLALDRNDGKF